MCKGICKWLQREAQNKCIFLSLRSFLVLSKSTERKEYSRFLFLISQMWFETFTLTVVVLTKLGTKIIGLDKCNKWDDEWTQQWLLQLVVETSDHTVDVRVCVLNVLEEGKKVFCGYFKSTEEALRLGLAVGFRQWTEKTEQKYTLLLVVMHTHMYWWLSCIVIVNVFHV